MQYFTLHTRERCSINDHRNWLPGRQTRYPRPSGNQSLPEIFRNIFLLSPAFSLSLKSKVHSSLFRCSVWKIGVSEYRGSAAGFLIAAERKSRLERRRLTVPGIEPVNHWLYMGRCLQSHVNCWQHSFLDARPARIIHIFTGSQINSPRAHPEARILKPGTSFGQLEFKQNPSPVHLMFRLTSPTKTKSYKTSIHLCSCPSPKPNLLLCPS